MNKLIKLLALGTVLPLSLNSLNLVSVSYSSNNSLSTGVTIDKQAKEIENTARRYCNSLNANLENLYKTGGTMGCLYNGGNLTKASELAAELLQGGNTSAEGSFNTGDKATVAILIDVVSKGLRWDFTNGVNDMIKSIEMFLEHGGTLNLPCPPCLTAEQAQKIQEKYRKGRNYLATAVFQEMLVKLRDTGSAILNKWEYDECCENVIKYLKEKSGKELKHEGKNGKEIYLKYTIQTMICGTIPQIMGTFYSSYEVKKMREESNRDAFKTYDIRKRLKYKKYFRDCTLKGIEKYNNAKNKIISSQQGPNGAGNANLYDVIKRWKDSEARLYENIDELQELRTDAANLLNFINTNSGPCATANDEFINYYVIENNPKWEGTGEIKVCEKEVPDSTFNLIKKYAENNNVVGIDVGENYKGIKYATLNKVDYVFAAKMLGKYETDTMKKNHELVDNNSSQFSKRVKKLCDSPAVRMYTEYHKLYKDLLGEHLKDLSMYQAVKLLSWHLKGIAILNRFTTATESEMELFEKKDSYLVSDLNEVDHSLRFATNCLNNIGFKTKDFKYGEYWEQQQLEALCNDVGNLKASDDIDFSKVPVHFDYFVGNYNCCELGKVQDSVNNKFKEYIKNYYNTKLSDIKNTMDLLVSKMTKLNRTIPDWSALYGQHKTLSSIYAWLAKMNKLTTDYGHFGHMGMNVKKQLSFYRHYDENDELGEVFKNIVQWGVLYDGLMSYSIDDSKNSKNENDWLKNSKQCEIIRSSLLPIFDAMNGRNMQFVDMFKRYVTNLRGSYGSIYASDYDYLVIDNEVMEKRLKPLTEGKNIPENEWKDWYVSLLPAISESMRFCKLDWRKMGNKLVVLKCKDSNEKILAYERIEKSKYDKKHWLSVGK